MSIQLTWNTPQSDAPVESYRLYKRIGTGPLTENHLFALIAGETHAFEDTAYTKTVLEGEGYTYALRAQSVRGIGPFSNLLHITYTFEGQ